MFCEKHVKNCCTQTVKEMHSLYLLPINIYSIFNYVIAQISSIPYIAWKSCFILTKNIFVYWILFCIQLLSTSYNSARKLIRNLRLLLVRNLLDRQFYFFLLSLWKDSLCRDKLFPKPCIENVANDPSKRGIV